MTRAAIEPGFLTAPRAVGASLVVLYRDQSELLKGITIYDGGSTKRAFQSWTQRMIGFYDPKMASQGAKSAKMTHVVGDGRLLLTEQLKINGQTFPNPFRSANGPKWDNFTANVALQENNGAAIMTVDPGLLVPDCVSWSALVLNTPVRDTDRDGKLDVWESTPGGAPIDPADPNSPKQPDLHAMRANPMTKDLFVEIGYMHTGVVTSYAGVPRPPHSHLPTEKALSLMSTAFKNAPVNNPDGSTGINVHIDVGGNYQAPNVDPATGQPYPPLPTAAACQAAWQPRCALVQSDLARGGEAIDESITVCPPDPNDPTVCQFSDATVGPIPGTVGWKTGFRFLRDEVFNPPPLLPNGDDPCDLPGNTCQRRFDSNRMDTHRYVLFAHALGIPKASCLVDGPDADGDLDTPDEICQETNPDFHRAVTNSGINDFPGGDGMVTLGAFLNADGLPIGSDQYQGATLFHELGHGFELAHGGPASLDPAVERKKNCAPHQLSTMNWLYQLHGLVNLQGEVKMDYSRQVIAPGVGIDETSLLDTPLAGGPLYRSSWYAPLATSNLNGLAAAATRHCDGTILLAGDLPSVRVDGAAVGPIDWNSDGTLDTQAPSFTQDVNFDGSPTTLASSENEWAAIRLNQLGIRRNVGGQFISKDSDSTLMVGPMSLDVGRGDTGRGDTGRGDTGRGDTGRGDTGRGDTGRGDTGTAGRGDTGRGDTGRGDTGRGAFGLGDTNVGAEGESFDEIPLEVVLAMAGDAPPAPIELEACLTDGEGECVTEGDGDLPVRLDWQAPGLGTVASYEIFKFAYDPEAPFPPATLPTVPFAIVELEEGEESVPTTYFDDFACGGPNLAYFVKARFDDGSLSPISNYAKVVTPITICFQDLGVEAPPATLGDPATLGEQEITPFNDTRECGADVTTVPSPLGGVLTFDTSVAHRTANTAEGPCVWVTWSHGFTGDVYFDYVGEGRDATTLTMTLPAGTTGFYFYAEPNTRQPFLFTITTSDGEVFETSTEAVIDGEGGARGFAFYSDFATITSIVVTTEAGANGFAVGEFGIARRVQPEP